MLMRSIVAALDWNSNIDRAYKTSASGEQLFKPKVCWMSQTVFTQNLFQFDRSGKKMTVAPIKEEKNYRFQDEIMNACIKAMEEDSIPVVDVSI